MSFVNEFDRMASIKKTENGGLAYNSTGDKLLDLFATIGSMRNRSEKDIISLYLAARSENVELADKIVLYVRSIRGKGGLGERKIGKILLRELARLDSNKIKRNFQTIVDNGRFDDLYCFCDTPVENDMWKFMEDTFKSDLINMENKKPITLAAKWMKSINTSSSEARRMARKFCKFAHISEKSYRKGLAALRSYSNVVETKMSARDWASINFEEVPSLAMKKYAKAFNEHCPGRFELYKEKLVSGEAKINASTLYPYDIVYPFIQRLDFDKDVAQAQWKALPHYFSDGKNVLVMADVSGSMTWGDGNAIAASIGLALYCAERNIGPYHGKVLTFTDKPSFFDLDDSLSIWQKIDEVNSHVGYSTNLEKAMEAVYDMATRSGEAPQVLLIISDNEIDHFGKPGACDDIVEIYRKKFSSIGVEMPRLVFWQAASRQNTFLARGNNPYVSFVSGVSAGTFANLSELIELNPFEAMVKILDAYNWN